MAYALTAFAALFIVLTPFVGVSAFVALSSGISDAREKARIVLKTSLAVAVIMLAFLFGGNYVFRLFGITLPAFQIAGGIVIFGNGLAMIRAHREVKYTDEEASEGVSKEDFSVVPLAIPMLCGPATISTVMVYAAEASDAAHLLGLSAAVVLSAAAVYVLLRLASDVARFLGLTGHERPHAHHGASSRVACRDDHHQGRIRLVRTHPQPRALKNALHKETRRMARQHSDRLSRDTSQSIVPEVYAHRIVRSLYLRIDDQPGRLGAVATAIGRGGGLVGEVTRDWLDVACVYRRITVYVEDEAHLRRILADIEAVGGVDVLAVEDEVLKIHEGGKIEVRPRVSIHTMEDLGRVYTPGVASVSKRIQADPSAARAYTWIANTVAIVTNGTAVLGLGDIGPLAGLPVMEGKSLILKELAGVNCIPILVDSKDTAEIISTVERIATGFGAIMLEDIAAPACFEIEAELDRRLPVPVFHDDQHGTAVVVLAGLLNALKQVKKPIESVSVVVMGAGAAGTAIAKMLVHSGVGDIVVVDRAGAIYERRKGNNAPKEELARITNRSRKTGGLDDLVPGSDVFIGVSKPGVLSAKTVSRMNAGAIVFALANPDPEIGISEALAAGAAVATDGRAVNNALAFPGIMRGALDSGAAAITGEMKLAAARAIAESAQAGSLLPNLLDPRVHARVAQAVAAAAGGSEA